MKRRATLQAGIIASISAAALPASAIGGAIRDRRLIGSWRSDRERTAELYRYKAGLDASTRDRIAEMFGKLTLRFTDHMLFSEYEGQLSAAKRYRIVATDYHSVVIEYKDDQLVVVEQLFIEGEYLYKLSSGYNLEFFRRVEA